MPTAARRAAVPRTAGRAAWRASPGGAALAAATFAAATLTAATLAAVDATAGGNGPHRSYQFYY